MANRKGPDGWEPLRRLYDAFDSRARFALFESNRTFIEAWRGYTAVMDVFRVTGWRKGLVFLLSEGVTLGAVGAVFLLALAIPAFNTVGEENWLKRQELSVSFLDRYGAPIGRRGIGTTIRSPWRICRSI